MSKGIEKFYSDAISKLSGGEFSHAALVISSTEIVEALNDGVGPTSPMSGWVIDGKTRTHVIRIEECTKAAVYRHPSLTQLDDEVTREKLKKIVKPFFGLPYSELPRLLNALRVSGRSPAGIEFLAKTLQGKGGGPPGGLFCTEVVATAFDQLSLHSGYETATIFDVGRLPDHVNPNDLTTSNLVEVNGVVIMPSRLPPGALELDQQVIDPRFYTKTMARMRKSHHEIRELGKSAREHAEKLRVLTKQTQDQNHDELVISSAQLERRLRLNEQHATSLSLTDIATACVELRSTLREMFVSFQKSKSIDDAIARSRLMLMFDKGLTSINLESMMFSVEIHRLLLAFEKQQVNFFRNPIKWWRIRRNIANVPKLITDAQAQHDQIVSAIRNSLAELNRRPPLTP